MRLTSVLQPFEMLAVEPIGRAEIHRHAVLDDLVLLEDLVEDFQRPAAVAHVVFGDDLEPVDGRLLAENVVVMRDAQADADAEVGVSVEAVGGHKFFSGRPQGCFHGHRCDRFAFRHKSKGRPAKQARPIGNSTSKSRSLNRLNLAAALAFAGVLAFAAVVAGLAAALPLQSFIPLQSCLSPSSATALTPTFTLETIVRGALDEALNDERAFVLVVEAERRLAEPAIRPPMAAAANIILVLFIGKSFRELVEITSTGSRDRSGPNGPLIQNQGGAPITHRRKSTCRKTRPHRVSKHLLCNGQDNAALGLSCWEIAARAAFHFSDADGKSQVTPPADCN